MVYGQMNEPPGNRLRVALTGLTMAEYFRDEKTESARAATCCSSSTTSTATRSPAPKCRRCSDACRRRWATSRRSPRRWACCRSASRRRRPARSRRSRPCTCPRTTSPTRRRRRPSRTSTRPSCCRARSPRSASIRRWIRSTPPAASSIRWSIGEEHYNTARGVQAVLQRYKELQDIIAILGMDELSEDDKLHRVARAQDPALPVAAVQRRRRCSPARTASIVSLKDTIRGFKGILAGEYDHLPEQAFYMVGDDRGSGREGEDAAVSAEPDTADRSMATIHVDIVSAEGEIFSGEATMVFAPAIMGDIGIAPRHAPLLTTLKPGEVRVQTPERRGAVLLRVGRRPRGPAAPRDRAGRHGAARPRPRRGRGAAGEAARRRSAAQPR